MHSLTLLQGVLSLWSFVPVIHDSDRSGYLRPVLERGLVTGLADREYQRLLRRCHSNLVRPELAGLVWEAVTGD